MSRLWEALGRSVDARQTFVGSQWQEGVIAAVSALTPCLLCEGHICQCIVTRLR